MGWNEGYTTMERTVVELYNAGTLTKELLDSIMEPYKGTDCDHGGSRDLVSRDGKSADEIICCIMEPERYLDAAENPEYYPGEPETWESNKKMGVIFGAIWRDRWGIW